MMNFKNLFALFLLFNFTLHAQVVVTNTNLKVNNNSISNNTITFDSNPTITISLIVHMETADESVNNTFGNLFLYYKKNATDNPTQIGFQSITFAKNYPKTNYYNDTYFSPTTLSKNLFFSTGGIIYAEYKNNNNKIYQSSQILVNGGSLTIDPASPTPTNKSIITKNLNYSDGLQITNSKIFVTADTPTYFNIDVESQNSDQISTNTFIYLLKNVIGSLPSGDSDQNRILLTSKFYSDGIGQFYSFKNIKIDPKDLDFTKYTYTLKIEVKKYSQTSNLAVISINKDFIYKDNKTLNVVLTKPIIDNVISDNQSILPNNTAKPFIGTIAKISVDTRSTTNITKYQWQQKNEGNNWIDITGVTFQNYSPTNKFTQNTSFRRIAISDDGFQKPSEYITISTTVPPINNICCNQTLPYNTSQPSTFTGNIHDNSFSYQWQISQKSSPFINIADANNSNCNYTFLVESSRGNESALFRRLVLQNESIIGVSNSIIVTRTDATDPSIILPPPVRVDVPGRRLSTRSVEPIQNDINNLSIYPNPIIDSFFIEGSVNIDLINIYDSFGGKLNIDKHQKSDNLIEVNTSRLQPGIFILKVDNTTFSKTLIKN